MIKHRRRGWHFQPRGAGVWVQPIQAGNYTARLAQGSADMAQALALRSLVFRNRNYGQDTDSHDDACLHVLVQDNKTQTVVCCYRLRLLASGENIDSSYSAQFYDLSRLAGFGGPMLELGRFCIHPDWHNADILRLAWAAMARLVDKTGATLLFGCTSFEGANGPDHDAALAVLKSAHLAPEIWRPLRKASLIYDFEAIAANQLPDPSIALRGMPPLLRTYLAMGAWVSNHAVLDCDLDTLHVFTAVEIAKIPPSRARALRSLAG